MKQRSFLCYLLCAVPFFMWQTAIALAMGTMPAMKEILYVVLGVHYLFAGIAMLIAGLICDKFIQTPRASRLFAAVLSAAGGISTLALLFINSTISFIVVFFIATVCGFGVNGVLTGGLFVKIRQAYKPMGVGLSFAAATLIRTPIDISVKNGSATYTALIVFCAAAMFLLCAMLLLNPIRQSFEEQEDETPKLEPMVIGESSRLVQIAVICGILAYILFGISDNAMSSSSYVINAIFALRLTQIVSSAAVGFICLRFGYYAAVLSSLSFLGIGMLAHLFSWSGIAGLICSMATAVGFLLFSVPLRSIFAEVAKRGRYSYTISAFGFALYFIMQIVVAPVSGWIKNMDKDSAMVLCTLLFMVTAPLIVLLFYMLINSYRTKKSASTDDLNYSKDRWEKFNLSRREREILDLVLKGLLSREIAEILFVSESTVNWHVSNILKKTGMQGRSKLIEMNRGGEK